VLMDNQAVLINMQFPSSNLKKKHNAVAYHKTREAVAAKIIMVGHIRGDINVSDILTKPKGPMDYYRLLRAVMYGKNDTTTAPVKGSSRKDRQYSSYGERTDHGNSGRAGQVTDESYGRGIGDVINQGKTTIGTRKPKEGPRASAKGGKNSNTPGIPPNG